MNTPGAASACPFAAMVNAADVTLQRSPRRREQQDRLHFVTVTENVLDCAEQPCTSHTVT